MVLAAMSTPGQRAPGVGAPNFGMGLRREYI